MSNQMWQYVDANGKYLDAEGLTVDSDRAVVTAWIPIKKGNNVVALVVATGADSQVEWQLKENAKRIVGCVNACEELPNDALDGGWTAQGASAYAKNLEVSNAQLLAALQELLDMPESDGTFSIGVLRKSIKDKARELIAGGKGN